MEGADLEKEEEPAPVAGFAMEDAVVEYELGSPSDRDGRADRHPGVHPRRDVCRVQP
jgi:hypothetical protein